MSDKLKSLSDAIRLGATFRPQCRGTTSRRLIDSQIGTCALGAAMEAVFGFNEVASSPNGTLQQLAKRFPNEEAWFDIIVTWNDGSEYLTREQIADRLDERMGRK